ncbi:VirB8/TrbF family protein, partial [Klebsiella pneumoniae]|nr:VirB8/TrbF family protein [Klebsiella pneumoniae]
MATSSTPASSSAEPGYLDARADWNGQLGAAARSRHNWQVYAYCSLILNAIFGAGLFYAANQSKIAPYVVEVDKLGHAVAFAPASELHEPNERLYRW